MADAKAAAKSIVGEFVNRSGASVWKAIARYEVASESVKESRFIRR